MNHLLTPWIENENLNDLFEDELTNQFFDLYQNHITLMKNELNSIFWGTSPELIINRKKKKYYCCDACGKRFTQLNRLKGHRKYNCKNLETERLPKESCPECGKMLHKTTVYKHKKMAVRNQSRKILIK